MQKQKLDAYYLKLIGVTLMMTAACVADGNNKRNLAFAEDGVREIILEQFQLLSAGHLAEVIEWDNAIKNASETPIKCFYSASFTEYKVVETTGVLPDLDQQQALLIHNDFPELIGDELTYQAENGIKVRRNRNKYSLTTRAGPAA